MADKKLSKKAKDVIEDDKNVIFLSSVSLWEIQIKESLKKITLPKNFYEVVKSEDFEILPLKLEHVSSLRDLPRHHKDPFDRMLISQAREEKFALISADKNIKSYEIGVVF